MTDKNGNAVNFGTAETITFTNGVATVSAGNNGAMTLYKVETATIAATDGSISAAGADRLTVTVSHAAAAAIALTGATADLASGSTRTFTATIKDAFGNTVRRAPTAPSASRSARRRCGLGDGHGLVERRRAASRRRR